MIGFPSGAHQPAVKAHEAEVAVDAGATELDMVVNLGLVKAGEWLAVGDDIAAVRASTPDHVLLKVILETAALTDDEIVDGVPGGRGSRRRLREDVHRLPPDRRRVSRGGHA